MKENKRKIIIVATVALLLLLIIGTTFAYFMAQGNGSASRNVNVTTHTTDSLVFDIDKEITIDANQENFASGKGNQDDTAIATATLKANSATNSATAIYNVFFLIDDNNFRYTTTEKTAELILSIKKNGTPVTSIDGLTPVTVGDVTGFDITERKDNIEIAKDEAITVSESDTDHTTEDIWEVTVTLVNLDSNQNNNTGKTLNGRIYLSKNKSFLQVANAKTSKTADSITVNLNMKDTGAEIDKYYFAIEENGSALALENTKTKVIRLSNTNLTYYESDTPSYTFTGLTQGKKYNVYGYAQDTSGNKSNEYKKKISLATIASICRDKNIANCFAENYENDGNIYYHDGTLANGINDGSYRYSGANPDNWVCFGYDDETRTYANGWCPDDNLYRIIGVFNEKNVETTTIEQRIKLIKAYEAGENVLGVAQQGTASQNATGYKGKLLSSPGYAWSGSKSVNSNIWATSSLNTSILNDENNNYLKILGLTWSNKIATTEWKVGGNSNLKIYAIASVAYQNEIINPLKMTIEIAKVGLMYANDYGFAASQKNWNTTISKYNNGTNRQNNWLYLGVYEWTITPYSSVTGHVFNLNSLGSLDYQNSINTYVVRPSFYLKSNVIITGGEGTRVNPYRIA